MGLLGTAGGYLVYRSLAKRLRGLRGQVAAVAFAGWCSVVLASIGCAGQLACSHTVAFSTGFPVMATVHMLIGLGEGVISAAVFLAVRRVRPDLEGATSGELAGRDGAWGYGLVASLGVVLFVAPFASPLPNGLERVAARLGFAGKATGPILPAAAPDYHLPGVHSATVATALGGAVGTIVVFAFALLLGRILVRDKHAAKNSSC